MCWKDNLVHLVIIYFCLTTIVPFRKEETTTFINVFFNDHNYNYNQIIKPNYVMKYEWLNNCFKYIPLIKTKITSFDHRVVQYI